MEIREKLAVISSSLEMMKSTYNLHDSLLRDRSDHTGRIEEIEKLVGFPAKANRGRREGDVQ